MHFGVISWCLLLMFCFLFKMVFFLLIIKITHSYKSNKFLLENTEWCIKKIPIIHHPPNQWELLLVRGLFLFSHFSTQNLFIELRYIINVYYMYVYVYMHNLNTYIIVYIYTTFLLKHIFPMLSKVRYTYNLVTP